MREEIRRLGGLNVPQHIAVALTHHNRERNILGQSPIMPGDVTQSAVAVQAGGHPFVPAALADSQRTCHAMVWRAGDKSRLIDINLTTLHPFLVCA
jgi:hypothetical protein